MIIRDKDKDKILSIAEKIFIYLPSLWAYGSRVNGDAHDMSDLDLVVVSKDNQKIDTEELVRFKNSLNDSNIPILIQVVDWDKIPKKFHQNILANYKKLL